MALLINPASPLGSDAPSTLDDQIRDLKQAIIDIFGLPSATTISPALMAATAAGLSYITLRDAAANSASAGRLGRNDNALSFHDGDQATRIALTVASSFVAVGNTGAGPDDLRSYTLPAGNFFGADGRALRVTGGGSFANNAGNKTLVISAGGITATLNTVTANPNNLSWFAQFIFGRVDATNMVGRGFAFIGAAQEVTNLSVSGAVTWANPQTFKFTGASAAPAANDVVQNAWMVEILQ